MATRHGSGSFPSLLTVLCSAALSAGCTANDGESAYPGGVYEVTLQTGSDPTERPACLDQSRTLADVAALFPDLEYFALRPVDESGEPVSVGDAVYWGFVQCAAVDCETDPSGAEAYPLLGSPTITDLTGSYESYAFGYSEAEQWAECLRIVLTIRLFPGSDERSLRLEFVHEMVFSPVGYDADLLDELETQCLSSPPDLPPDPCTRREMLEGVRME